MYPVVIGWPFKTSGDTYSAVPTKAQLLSSEIQIQWSNIHFNYQVPAYLQQKMCCNWKMDRTQFSSLPGRFWIRPLEKVSSAFALPKSATFRWPSFVRRRFSGCYSNLNEQKMIHRYSKFYFLEHQEEQSPTIQM